MMSYMMYRCLRRRRFFGVSNFYSQLMKGVGAADASSSCSTTPRIKQTVAGR